MKGKPDVLFVQEEAVAAMPFEILPDLFNRIEFRRVSREPFNMEPWMSLKNRPNERALVDFPVVPEQYDFSSEVAEHCAQEPGHMRCLEVLLLKAYIEPHVLLDSGDREGCQSRDAIVLVAIEHDGRIALRTPGPMTRRDDQEAALVKEDEVGTKFSAPFFLSRATCTASSV